MTLENAIKKAKKYSDKHLPFSGLKYWKVIFEKTGKPYHQFRYADSLRLCGFFKESEEIYLTISINKIPKEWRHVYYIYLGYLYSDIGKFSDALSAYLKSLKLKSDDTIPYIFIASILKLQDKNEEAIKYLEKALNKFGDIDEVNYNLATSYLRVGQIKNASKAISDCLLIDPKYPNAKNIKKDIEELIKQTENLIIN